jgi:hypothetical protein
MEGITMKHLNLGRVLLLALCICLAATLLTAFSPARSAYAATARPTACSNLNYAPGHWLLNANYKEIWTTCKGNAISLNMQLDGNFVLYVNGQAKWASNTSGLTAMGNYAQFLPNGALRVYDISTISGPYLAWSSGTGGKGARLSLQDDGNVVIYNASGTAIWATHTSGY